METYKSEWGKKIFINKLYTIIYGPKKLQNNHGV